MYMKYVFQKLNQAHWLYFVVWIFIHGAEGRDPMCCKNSYVQSVST